MIGITGNAGFHPQLHPVSTSPIIYHRLDCQVFFPPVEGHIMDHRNIHIPFGPTDSELAVIHCLRQTEGLGDFKGHPIDMILTLPSISYLLLTIILPFFFNPFREIHDSQSFS